MAAFFILFLSHSYSTIRFLEAAGFRATERFSLTGFLRLSFRICHLQIWHSVTAYFFASPFLGSRHQDKALTFFYFLWKRAETIAFLLRCSWNIDTAEMMYSASFAHMYDLTWLFGVGHRVEDGDGSVGMGYLGEACSKTWTHARAPGRGLTYALIFYYRLMSRPVVPLIKCNVADTSS